MPPKVKFALKGQMEQLEKNWEILDSTTGRIRSAELENTLKCPIKWFNPTGAGTWIGLAKKPGEPIVYGYAHINEWELGYFSLDELQEYRDPRFGLGIERDMYWEPKTIPEIQQILAEGKTYLL
jgi:hypothetical protein